MAKLQDLAQEQKKFEIKKEKFFRDYYRKESKRNQGDARTCFRYPEHLVSSALCANLQIQSEWEAKLEKLLKTRSRFMEDEVDLSPTADVLCGVDRCSWNIFSVAARYLRACLKLPSNQILNVILQISDMKGNLSYKYPDIIHLVYEHDEAGVWVSEVLGHLKAVELKLRRSLTVLLIAFSRSKAQDPTDRIAALLSLTNDTSQRLLKPNYSLGAGHAYQRAMIKAFSENMGLVLLENFVSPSLSHIPGTSSCVPDFACFSPWCDVLEISEEHDLDHDPYRIEDNFTHPEFTVHGNLLSAYGEVLDSIAYCTSIISPAGMYHFQSNHAIREGHLILDQCLPRVHDFTFIASVQEGVLCYESNPWLLEKSILDIIQSRNGQAALQDNGTSLSHYRIYARDGTRKSKQKWSSQLYVHNQGRQLLRTADGWLAIGPARINSLKVGDLIVSLGARSESYALRPLADGTHLSRGLVEVEDHSAVNYKEPKFP
ncbi:uncharacterized protein BP5553_00483 [Venustampulla echinocandica]|uniref:Heterokaryon incompatibility domain-containing protein n=1 Tax=Venustampulla echinocandica TaxID=2656787 RepID=A0A370TYB4_9HELO|nr:uncharacterized protein BP5553_00483 [Venustampulla echinocandica]RDL40504.1 hypothetical protein BP5553_00483 [Venustampulla echinocandica]